MLNHLFDGIADILNAGGHILIIERQLGYHPVQSVDDGLHFLLGFNGLIVLRSQILETMNQH